MVWVGETTRCDATSSVIGSTSDISWSTNGGYFSLSGSGFYRDVKVTQYFSGSATVTCSWKYRLTSSSQWTSTSKTWTFTCKDNPASVSPSTLSLKVDDSYQLSYSHTYTNSYTSAANAYFSTNSTCVTVTSNGYVTAVSPGTAYVTLYSKISANSPSCLVTVTEDSSGSGNTGNGNTNTNTESPGEAIDLGLSVLWASCNVGASNPEEYGDFYAWGETKTKTIYDFDHYVVDEDGCWTEKDPMYDKEYGVIWPIEETKFDVANVKWGSGWRMPTVLEIEELKDKCTWTVSTQNNVKGLKFKGPNENTIFIPFAGGYDGSYYHSDGSQFELWCSDVVQNTKLKCAYCLSYYSQGNLNLEYSRRNYGLSIRPVKDNPQNNTSRWFVEIDWETSPEYQLKKTDNKKVFELENVTIEKRWFRIATWEGEIALIPQSYDIIYNDPIPLTVATAKSSPSYFTLETSPQTLKKIILDLNEMTLTLIHEENSINTITVDNENTVHYYNLQGIEVLNVIPNMIYIKVVNGEPQKIVFH